MKLFGIFALAAVVVADFDYDSLGLKKPNKGSDAPAVDKVISCFWVLGKKLILVRPRPTLNEARLSFLI